MKGKEKEALVKILKDAVRKENARKIFEKLSDKRLLSAVGLLLMGLSQIVQGKISEEDTREIVRDELEKRKGDM